MNVRRRPITLVRKALTLGLAAAIVGGVTLVTPGPGPTPAMAQSLGKPHSQVVEVLRERYKETPAFMGLASGGAVIEVFTSVDGETWTIVMTLPNGMSRVLAAGESWEAVRLLVGQPI